jgi:hypothetical protein
VFVLRAITQAGTTKYRSVTLMLNKRGVENLPGSLNKRGQEWWILKVVDHFCYQKWKQIQEQ